MTTRTPLELGGYGISRALYNELKWFCKQYPDKVEKVNAVRGGFNSFEITGMPRGTSQDSDTERRAIRAIDIEADVRDIQQAAVAADASLYPYIIKNVTRGTRYEDMQAPCGINQFYHARRRFFWHLAYIRGKIGD